MHALTSEWIAKAEADWRVANREIRVQHGASYDAVCFHSQQCVEKYLKAFLQEKSPHSKDSRPQSVVRVLPPARRHCGITS